MRPKELKLKREVIIELMTDELSAIVGANDRNSLALCTFSCQYTCTCNCTALTMGISCNVSHCTCP